MTDNNNNSNQPEPETLRVQLTELNNRSRWYSAELWQVPFAYFGITGLVIVQIAEKKPDFLGISFIISAIFGAFVIKHMCRIRKHEIRAVENLQKTETELNLSPTTQKGSGLKIFQIAVIIVVIVYTLSGIYSCFIKKCNKSTIQQKTTNEMKVSKNNLPHLIRIF